MHHGAFLRSETEIAHFAGNVHANRAAYPHARYAIALPVAKPGQTEETHRRDMGEQRTMTAQPWPIRVVAAHPRTVAALAATILSYLLLPRALLPATRAVLAWDIGAALLLGLILTLFAIEGTDREMAENAEQQQDGEWTMFWIVLAGVAFSFVALTQLLANLKDMRPADRDARIALVAATLFLSWLLTHAVFALRYAHEFYTATEKGGKVDGGLDFPGEDTPDYWDFGYFSLVLGMTFQVSDVQITSRTLRRLAAVHGLIGFLFNTVIVALTVNIAAGLMG